MADVYVNALTTISTEPTSTDSIVCVNRNTNEGQIIDYNLLADKILDKITSKTYSSLSTTSKLIPGAINEVGLNIYNLGNGLTKLWQGRGALASTTSATDLITLPSGAYQVGESQSWIPSGGGSYGTLFSCSVSADGSGGYGFVLWVSTNGSVFIRHHSANAWHTNWVKFTTTTLS